MKIEMTNITKAFFGTPVLEGVDFSIESGEVHALLGENGAGKTTLMNILYGFYEKDSGEIYIDGKEVTIDSPKAALEHGIGMVHQHFQLVETLTVGETITLGLKEEGYPFSNRKRINKRILDLSSQYGLEVDPKKKIKNLSVGERQRVEIMKLLYRSAKILILDEPTAVLSPPEIETFFKVLKQLQDAGHGIVIITHKIAEVEQISDRVTVLRDGDCVLNCDLHDADENCLSQAMIGRTLKKREREIRQFDLDQPCLELQNVSVVQDKLKVLDDFSLKIAPGEIVGVAGVDGNGQQELAEAIVGIQSIDSGKVIFNGKQIQNQAILKRLNSGIGYIPADRHQDALLLSMDLNQNMLLKKHFNGDYLKHGLIDDKKTDESTSELVEKYKIKTVSNEQPIRYLSGGNQQKFVLARELEAGLKLLVVFQPTRGLDMGATEFVRNQLVELSHKGAAILLISTDLQEIMSLSDRIAVIYSGKNMGVLLNDGDLDVLEIGHMMGGKKHERA